MVIRTYFDKNTTIVSNSDVNTGLNPVAELFYGGDVDIHQFSRFLFQFDETRLISLYTGGTFTDLTKLNHTLRLSNTGSFDTALLNGTYGAKDRASSFDLILFTINQPWDNGVGYDYTIPAVVFGETAYSNGAANWSQAQTGIFWSGGTGVYSGSSSAITIGIQHFDKGNEDIEIDITDYVNSVITGATNYGLGLAFASGFEDMFTSTIQYVGFFTNNTHTFYEPYIESIYENHIKDDRSDFFLDKANKLYLYVNLAGNPTNLDSLPGVNVYDENDAIFSAYTSSAITHVTLGVYSIDISVPTGLNNVGTMYADVWTGVTINGGLRPDITLNFEVKDSAEYFNIGSNDMLPRKVGLSIGGLQNKEKIKRGDIRKVIVSARIPYTVEQTQKISDIKYRLYVTEGVNELTVIDFQPIEMAKNHYYFLLDTQSLIPNTYYLDVLVTSNLEVTTIKNAIQFDIISQVELRRS